MHVNEKEEQDEGDGRGRRKTVHIWRCFLVPHIA